jgi:quercetin dioxygenase-like cupin family protein
MFDLAVEGEIHHLEAGTVIVIPPNARHSGTSVTKSQIIDVFYPVREDFR